MSTATAKYVFKNIKKVQRNREVEGRIGAELGFEDGATLWVLCMSDANQNWRQHGDEFSNELRRLVRANADEDRQKAFLAEWYAKLFVIRWNVVDDNDRPVTFSQEACQAYLLESDDAIPAIREMISDNKRFRGGRVEAIRANVGNSSSGTAETQ